MSDDHIRRDDLRARIAELEAQLADASARVAELEAALAAERALADDLTHQLETSGRWLESFAARSIARSGDDPS